jgi:hypothetical protein
MSSQKHVLSVAPASAPAAALRRVSDRPTVALQRRGQRSSSVRGTGCRRSLWVPRTPFLVLLGFEACISCFTRAREYQIAPNLARVCGLDLRGAELNSL